MGRKRVYRPLVPPPEKSDDEVRAAVLRRGATATAVARALDVSLDRVRRLAATVGVRFVQGVPRGTRRGGAIDEQALRSLLVRGTRQSDIARRLGVSRQSVSAAVKRWGIVPANEADTNAEVHNAGGPK